MSKLTFQTRVIIVLVAWIIIYSNILKYYYEQTYDARIQVIENQITKLQLSYDICKADLLGRPTRTNGINIEPIVIPTEVIPEVKPIENTISYVESPNSRQETLTKPSPQGFYFNLFTFVLQLVRYNSHL